MPCPVILALLDDQRLADDSTDDALAEGMTVGELLAPQPPSEHWRVLLQGSTLPRPGTDLRELLRAYGHSTTTVDRLLGATAETEHEAMTQIRERIAAGASLVLVRSRRRLLRQLLTPGCRHANTLVIGGVQQNPSCRPLLARGPDLIPGVSLRGALVDIKPSLLAHFEVLPPPGCEAEGRPLHQIFRWAHPRSTSREEWSARIRQLTELDAASPAGAE
jgi:hypothetical protein